MSHVELTYNLMNTDDVSELLTKLINMGAVTVGRDGKAKVGYLHNRNVGEIRKTIEDYTIQQFTEVRSVSDNVIHTQTYYDKDVFCQGKDQRIVMETKRSSI
jgi:hypothetical protein